MATTRPKIVLLQLNKKSWFDDGYSDLLQALSAKADIESITTRAAAEAFFRRGVVSTPVFATDESLGLPENRDLANLAATHVRNGGILVLGAGFSSHLKPSDMNTFFADTFSLPWRCGSYYRTDHNLNPQSNTIIRHTGLPAIYSMKAFLLQHVEHQDAIYLPSPNPRPMELPFALMQAMMSGGGERDGTECPVAMTTLGNAGGKVGYMGDINPEAELGSVVVGMLGLN